MWDIQVVSISVGSTNAQPSVMKGAAAWPHVRSEFGDHSFGIMCFFLTIPFQSFLFGDI